MNWTNRSMTLVIVSALLTFSVGAQAHDRTLASTMEVSVLPMEGQTAEQQAASQAEQREQAMTRQPSRPNASATR